MDISLESIKLLHKFLIGQEGISNDYLYKQLLGQAMAKERLAIKMSIKEIKPLEIPKSIEHNKSPNEIGKSTISGKEEEFQWEDIKIEPMESGEDVAVTSRSGSHGEMMEKCQINKCSKSSKSSRNQRGGLATCSEYSKKKNSLTRLCPTKMLAKLDTNKLAKARKKFTWMMEDMEEDRERVRQVISEHKYRHYLEVLGRLRENPQHRPNYRESRIANRFGLDANGQNLVDQKNGKPFLLYGDMFDCIYQCYLRPRFGGLRAIYAELKRNYANITLECMNIFMLACTFE